MRNQDAVGATIQFEAKVFLRLATAHQHTGSEHILSNVTRKPKGTARRRWQYQQLTH